MRVFVRLNVGCLKLSLNLATWPCKKENTNNLSLPNIKNLGDVEKMCLSGSSYSLNLLLLGGDWARTRLSRCETIITAVNRVASLYPSLKIWKIITGRILSGSVTMSTSRTVSRFSLSFLAYLLACLDFCCIDWPLLFPMLSSNPRMGSTPNFQSA